jgi:DNA-binding CsgD family transcriptional regulator
MPPILNSELWQEARLAGMESGLSLYALAGVQRHTLKYVSRLWIEKHGQRLAHTVSSILMRPVTVDDLFPDWDQPEERPLSEQESGRLKRAVEARSRALSPREMGVVRLTLGLEGQPVSLAQVAAAMGVTRERVRQIELSALKKLEVSLPRGLHKSPLARRRRARLLLKALTRKRQRQGIRIALSAGRRSVMGTASKTRAAAPTARVPV